MDSTTCRIEVYTSKRKTPPPPDPDGRQQPRTPRGIGLRDKGINYRAEISVLQSELKDTREDRDVAETRVRNLQRQLPRTPPTGGLLPTRVRESPRDTIWEHIQGRDEDIAHLQQVCTLLQTSADHARRVASLSAQRLREVSSYTAASNPGQHFPSDDSPEVLRSKLVLVTANFHLAERARQDLLARLQDDHVTLVIARKSIRQLSEQLAAIQAEQSLPSLASAQPPAPVTVQPVPAQRSPPLPVSPSPGRASLSPPLSRARAVSTDSLPPMSPGHLDNLAAFCALRNQFALTPPDSCSSSASYEARSPRPHGATSPFLSAASGSPSAGSPVPSSKSRSSAGSV